MTSTNKDPILVVVQLTGGNDYITTNLQTSLFHIGIKVTYQITTRLPRTSNPIMMQSGENK